MLSVIVGIVVALLVIRIGFKKARPIPVAVPKFTNHWYDWQNG